MAGLTPTLNVRGVDAALAHISVLSNPDNCGMSLTIIGKVRELDAQAVLAVTVRVPGSAVAVAFNTSTFEN